MTDAGRFYDQPGVLPRYTSTAPGRSDPKAAMEWPALREELGDVTGARVLDLGCGDAAVATWLMARGAASYLGVDASSAMLASAVPPPGAQVRLGAIESFDADAGSADLVLSRLALHYVDDVAAVLVRARRWLAPGGRLLVSVVHPVVTSHDARPGTDTPRTSWVVDDYFVTGPRPQRWLGGEVTFFHRTVEQYVTALTGAGFALTALRECAPDPDAVDDPAELGRRRRIPLFLLLAAQ